MTTNNLTFENFSVIKLHFKEGIIKQQGDKYHICIPLAPFILEEEEVETTIELDDIMLPNRPVDCIGKTLKFPTNPVEGYIDASIYLAYVHNPIDVTEISFLKVENNLITLEISMYFNFEFENTGLGNEFHVAVVSLVIT